MAVGRGGGAERGGSVCVKCAWVWCVNVGEGACVCVCERERGRE